VSSSLPDVQCPSGPLVATEHSRAAQGALNRTLLPNLSAEQKAPLYQQALASAQAGIAADPANPVHHFQAGQAYVGLGQLAEAGEHFGHALEACPALSAEIDPMAEQAWLTAFQAGLEAYQAGDTTRAISTWEAAGRFYNKRADTFYNLGILYGERGDYAKAVENYREALAALERTPNDTSQALIASEAETRANTLAGLLNAGAQLFLREDFRGSAEVFGQLHQIDPNNRDAWYNHALALYKLERWSDLIPVGTRLVEIDPLNYNGRIILFNAYKGLSDQAKAANNAAVERTNRDLALRTLEAADALPVQVDGIQLENAEGSVRITGRVTGAGAAAGTPIRLEFTVFGATGRLGSQTVTVSAPAKDASTSFELTIPTTGAATGYSYRQVTG
jgi:tetratricopeptide (TPR) repeat protein